MSKENKENTEKKNGTGNLWRPIVERLDYVASNGLKYEFVDYWDKLKIVRAWEYRSNNPNETMMNLMNISIFNLSIDDLKEFKVWDLLSDEDKQTIEKKQPVKAVKEKVDENGEVKIKKTRTPHPEYEGVPKNYKCHKCNKEVIMQPGQVLKRCALHKITPEDLVKTYVCLSCDSTQRGRKSSGKYDGLPKELHCSHPDCKNIQVQHPSMTVKASEKLGMDVKTYIANWKCKSHRIKKAHHLSKEARIARGEVIKPAKIKVIKYRVEGEVLRRGRAPNPLFAGIPHTTKCTGCGKEITLVAQNILDKAKILGITVEALLKNYKGRCCGGKLKKVDKVK
jgi:hypothetical protein